MKHQKKFGSKRTTLKKYVFVLGSAAAMVARGAADTVGLFTFESYATSASTAGVMTSGNLTADSGSGTAFGVHTGTSSYTFPSGNGSARAFSSTNFAVGDYFQFQIDATGYTNLAVSFDMAKSTTGAPTFNLQYSTDGTNFVTLTTFNVFTSGTTGTTTAVGGTTSGTVSFVTGSSNSAFNVSANLSTVTGLNNAVDYFRIAAASTGASTGTDRVDNFLLTGTAAAVPEPSTLALFSAAGVGAALAARRRKKA